MNTSKKAAAVTDARTALAWLRKNVPDISPIANTYREALIWWYIDEVKIDELGDLSRHELAVMFRRGCKPVTFAEVDQYIKDSAADTTHSVEAGFIAFFKA